VSTDIPRFDLTTWPDYWVDLFGTDLNGDGKKYITTGQQSLIVSMLSVGTFFGALCGASIGDRIGRRLGLLGTFSVILLLHKLIRI
jgi:MFS family permease